MNHRRIRKQSATTNYLRYLRPGALAQLRDSKINAAAKSHHLRSHISRISLLRTTSSSSPTPSPEVIGTVTTAGDAEMQFLPVRFYSPRCPQRKKLMAVRSIMCFSSDVIAVDSLIDAL